MLQIENANSKSITIEQRKAAYEILRVAYALTEIEVWGENYVRIDFEAYNELIEKGEILMAFYEAEVVGAVHHYEREKGVHSFSLLSADFAKSGLGIGRTLVNKVEEIAKRNGCTAIQLEILRPKGIEVPFKKRISDWYQRMGYQYTHSQNFAEVKPIKAQNLVNPSDFDYYLKELV